MDMMKVMKLLLAGLVAGSCEAAVMLTELSLNNSISGNDVTLNSFALTAGSNSVLVISAVGEDGGDISASVNSNAAVELVDATDGSEVFASVFAFALGDVTAGTNVDILIDFAAESSLGDGGYSIFQLFGATQTFTEGSTYWQDGMSTGSDTDPKTNTLTGVTAGSVLISSIVGEPGNANFITGLVGYDASNDYDAGGTGVGWGYNTDVSGTVNTSFTLGSPLNAGREIAFGSTAIAAIPEPGSLGLLAMALGLCLLCQKRRSS